MERALSAPGKLFLCGEYSVLWGGLARILAVAPRMNAWGKSRTDRRVDIFLEEGRLSGTATPAGVKWDSEVTAPFHFVARTFDLVFRLIGTETTGLAAAFEPSPTERGLKLGVGSSARACVLASELARTCLGGGFDALKLALVSHANAQNGRGSGGDVAAIFAGGVVRYRRYEVSGLLSAANAGALGSALNESDAVDLVRTRSPELPLIYAYSGAAASTPNLIAEVERTLNAAARRAFVASSESLGDALEQALAKGEIAAVRETMRGLQELLWSLGPTRNDVLTRILQIADTFGVAGKQSGAGGGDGCILVAPDADAARAVVEALLSRGMFATLLQLEPGLRGEVAPMPLLARWLSTADGGNT